MTSLLWRRANAWNVSQHTLRRSAYPYQPYVDTLYVLPHADADQN